MSLDNFDRYPLLFGPSPVHPLDRLSDHLGVPASGPSEKTATADWLSAVTKPGIFR